MSEKRVIAILAAAVSAVLCISLFIAVNGDNARDEDVIMVINSSVDSGESSDIAESINGIESESANTTESVRASTKVTSTPSVKTTKTAADEKIWLNINVASEEELAKLDGIGESIAARIVEYRETNGGFNNIEEIMNVKGIGEKKFQLICDCIYVLDPTYDDNNDIESGNEEEYYDGEPEYDEEFVEESIPEDDGDSMISRENTEETEQPVISETEPVLTLEEAAPININEADVDELMLLPHVTEEIAEKIIKLRENINGYQHPYELLYIDELEQNEVAEIIEFVTIGQ